MCLLVLPLLTLFDLYHVPLSLHAAVFCTYKPFYHLCKQSYLSFFHLSSVTTSVSLVFQLIWPDLTTLQAPMFYFYCLLMLVACPCPLNVPCLFILRCWACSLTPIQHLFCYCVCLVPQVLY